MLRSRAKRPLATARRMGQNPGSMSTEEKPLVRGEPVVAKVLAATVEEIALSGYAALTLERVASRAGVNRTTIFRRWPTKKDLVLATLERLTAEVKFDWDHGSLREDLQELVTIAARTVFAPGMLGMHKMLIEARMDPELSEVARCIRDDKHEGAINVLKRAERRGEFRKDLDKELFLDSLMGMLFAKLVFKHEAMTPEFMRRMLDHVMKIATPVRPRGGTPRKVAAARPAAKRAGKLVSARSTRAKVR